MSIATARSQLAAGITAAGLGVTGYARPPGQIAAFPAAVVQDPASIIYHAAAGRRTIVDLDVRVIVSRQAADDGTVRLDELVTFAALPASIEAITGASWTTIAVTELAAGYADFAQGGQIIGVAADLTVRLTLNT